MHIRRCLGSSIIRYSIFVTVLIWAIRSAPVGRVGIRTSENDRAYKETMKKYLQRYIDTMPDDVPELREKQIESLQRRIAELDQGEEPEELGDEFHVIRYIDFDDMISKHANTAKEAAVAQSPDAVERTEVSDPSLRIEP